MTKSARNALPDKCFLRPSVRKYPICPEGVPRISCRGLLAASARARLQKDDAVQRKADKALAVQGCHLKAGYKRDKSIMKASVKHLRRETGHKPSKATRTRKRARKAAKRAARTILVPKSRYAVSVQSLLKRQREKNKNHE